MHKYYSKLPNHSISIIQWIINEINEQKIKIHHDSFTHMLKTKIP